MALEFPKTSGLGGRGISSTVSPATSAGDDYNSPISPLSPPSSPVLYPIVFNTSNNNNNTLKNHHQQQSISRAQMAKSYLQDIEEMEMEISTENDLSMAWNEESIPLFEELGTISGLDGEEQSTDLEQSGEDFSETTNDQVIIQHELEKPAQVQSQGFENLTAEFEAILNSLPGSFDMSNVESLLSFSMDHGLEDLMDAELNEDDGNECDDENGQEESTSSSIFEIDEITEAELNEDVTDYTAIDTSNWSTDEGSIVSEPEQGLADEEQDYQNQDQDDIDANKSEKILDALLKGDIYLAQSFTDCNKIEAIASTSNSNQQKDTDTSKQVNQRPKRNIISKRKAAEDEIESPPESPAPKKRGRKPSSATRSLSKIKDKKLRKKEQNKTAATRYRNRKRMETMSTLEIENELDTVNGGLKKETLELASQIKMIKQLVLEVFLSKKKKN